MNSKQIDEEEISWGEVVDTLEDIEIELKRALKKHRTMASSHEGYAILLEEVDELWDEIKSQNHNCWAIRKEAIQVAAMALEIAVRFGERAP